MPRYRHSCSGCEYLCTEVHGDTVLDVYRHPSPPSTIIRYGDEAWEYVSFPDLIIDKVTPDHCDYSDVARRHYDALRRRG